MIDIEKIPRHLKSLLINIILFPFWIISIYIFKPELYKTNDYLIIGSLCISLTIVSSLLTSIIFLDSKKNEHILEQHIIIASATIQSLLLSIIIFSGYLFNVFFNIKFEFYGFLATYFGILTVFSVLRFIDEQKILEKRNIKK